MIYSITNDPTEIDRIALDICICHDRKAVVSFDLADIKGLKREGNIVQALVVRLDKTTNGWVEEFVEFARSKIDGKETLSNILMNIIEGGDNVTLSHAEMSEILKGLTTIMHDDKDADVPKSEAINYMWGLCSDKSLPQGTLQIQLLVTQKRAY